MRSQRLGEESQLRPLNGCQRASANIDSQCIALSLVVQIPAEEREEVVHLRFELLQANAQALVSPVSLTECREAESERSAILPS